jgi:hypothetical protein
LASTTLEIMGALAPSQQSTVDKSTVVPDH